MTWLTRLLRKLRRDTVAISVCSMCGRYEGTATWDYNGEAWCVTHTYCVKCVYRLYPEEEAA